MRLLWEGKTFLEPTIFEEGIMRFKLIESIYTWETDRVISDDGKEMTLREACDYMNKQDKYIKELEGKINNG